MSDFDLGDGFRKAFLASVGAVATVSEKSQQVIDDFVKKGELTVEQGKAINEELKRKARETVSDSNDAALRARMESMTPEERAEYAKKVADMAADINAQAVEPDSVEDADNKE
ncbi:MAG: phasin family protein [Tractidigestivibacter sp.]|jgi:polyhydroxyalkanoate synthesis regulator phasin|uniref:phasin family protein n=1 Tax=Tractidigestivibacter sp. TaxID=2847320 RepID=UPI003D94A974